MDKKNKSILIVCVVVILLAIGIATSYVVIKKIQREKTKIDLPEQNIVQVEEDEANEDREILYDSKIQVLNGDEL